MINAVSIPKEKENGLVFLLVINKLTSPFSLLSSILTFILLFFVNLKLSTNKKFLNLIL